MSCTCPSCSACSTPNDVRTACDCCAGTDFETPISIHNRPSLAQIDWRVGTYGSFAQSMEAGIRRGESLSRLATRRSDDWTIGLIDAWASALDVLTFYQERWAQELYLGTALERRSMIELARLIGYQLAPGVAARVPLAFSLDDGPGSPKRVMIPAGTRAQSLPQAKDELPQSFETSHDLTADVRFGRLHPRRFAKHPTPAIGDEAFWIRGTSSGLRRGDTLLLVASSTTEGSQDILRVMSVEPRADEGRTLLRCAAGVPAPTAPTDRVAEELKALRLMNPDGFVNNWVAVPDLLHELEEAGRDTDPDQVIEHVKQTWPREPIFDATDFSSPGLYAMRVRARPFGHNAPRRASLPTEMQPTGNWDTGTWPIHRTANYGRHQPAGLKGAIHTDQSYPEIVDGSWVILRRSGETAQEDLGIFTVASPAEESLADFGISGKATRLELNKKFGGGPGSFHLRKTTLFAGAERLELAPLPIEALPAGTTDLLLDELVPHIEPGRLLIIEGERLDNPGLIAREEVMVEAVRQDRYTWIILGTGLVHGYALQTVTIHGNVAEATHGESKTEVLGSGDASLAHQRFKLRGAPLTHTPSPDAPGGAASSLQIWVDGVRWNETPSFYPLDACERAFTERQDDQHRSWIQFGDGARGARLPTGAENVFASFRVGIGTPGMVDAGRISLLQNPPLGVREVINPTASADAEDPETVEGTRDNAPQSVRTLGRVVSLSDFEDFARTWAGVAKARADRVWDGSRRVVHVSVAGSDGAVPSDDLLDDLRIGLDKVRDPRVPLRLGAFSPLRFGIQAKLNVAPDRRFDDVAEQAQLALEIAFAFDARELGQAVRNAEIMAVLHQIEGIEAVDVDSVAGVGGDTPQADAFGLVAAPAHLDVAGGLNGAQLLTLGPSWSDPLLLTPWPSAS